MKKKKIVTIGVIALLIAISIIGGSYAYLKVVKEGSNQNISIANLGVVIKTDMKEVTLENEVPKRDEEGLKNTPNTFVIKNEGKITAKYRLSLIDSKTISTMSNLDIRYRVTRTSNKTNTSEVGEVKSLGVDGLFDEGVIAPDEEISYELILWINYEANPNGLVYSKVLSLEGLQADTLDTSGANPPEMLSNMIPVYYDKVNATDGVWRKADASNLDASHKWYDYNDFMWANAVTVKDDKKVMSDITGNSIMKNNQYFTVLENGNIYFDGVDDFYNLGHANENLGNNITLVARFKIKSFLGGEQDIIGNFENSGTALEIKDNKKIAFYVHQGDEYHHIEAKEEALLDTWYTVVGIYDNSTMKLYINGEEANTPVSLTGNITTSIVPFALGGNPDDLGYGRYDYSNVEIERAMVYKRALDVETEVKKNFNGSISNPSNTNLLIDTENYEFESLYSKYKVLENGDLKLDGVDDFYYVGQEGYNFKNSVSVVTRVNVETLKYGAIISKKEAGGFEITLDSTNKISFIVHANGQYNYCYSEIQIKPNTWYTVVATYDNKNMQLYINGEKNGASTSLTGAITNTNASILIGADPGSLPLPEGYYSDITVSDAFIYTDVLTEKEISQYFKGEIVDYPKDNLLVGYDDFKGQDEREAYLKANPGTEIPMDEITSMWVWIPRYKYTIFNGNNGTSDEQIVNIEFERGINKTGTVSCHDEILTSDDSDHSEVCEDKTNGRIINGVSTYTHPAFTFGEDELVGFWFAKFEMSTDDKSCLENPNETNCNKFNLNLYSKPNEIIYNNAYISYFFANIRNMETYGNVHGFSQSKDAVSYLDINENLSGNIENDNNNYDIHMLKNMEWGAVTYLTMSKYGKYGNSLYSAENKEVYVNNYISNGKYKTGYSAKLPTANESATGVQYNDLTIESEGKGYAGAGASSTGTIYGIYDMNGGRLEMVMSNNVNKQGKFNFTNYSKIWNESNFPLDKYYDKYSYNSQSNSINSYQLSKLGDGIKEVMKDISNSIAWNDDKIQTTFVSQPFYRVSGLVGDGSGIFARSNSNGNFSPSSSCRAVLTITRDFPWLDN